MYLNFKASFLDFWNIKRVIVAFGIFVVNSVYFSIETGPVFIVFNFYFFRQFFRLFLFVLRKWSQTYSCFIYDSLFFSLKGSLFNLIFNKNDGILWLKRPLLKFSFDQVIFKHFVYLIFCLIFQFFLLENCVRDWVNVLFNLKN